MKPIYKNIFTLVSILLLTGPLRADWVPQPEIVFTQGLENTFAADWEGVAGRVYFMQWSLDLETWFYAPFIDFGDGMHSRGLAGSAPQSFFRLHCGDYPGITSLEQAMNADFDGDGLSNIFEVTFGLSPFHANSTISGPDHTLDSEEDGITNTTENIKGLDPMRKDNPKLLLQVSTD